jgi:succinate dehydrogenase / fumarate reductase, membrane anchor subunit
MTTPTARVVRGRSGSRFETFMWFFTRVTGILFLFMGAFNLIYANLSRSTGALDVGAQMRWAFFPISFHITSSNVEVTNFQNPFWEVWSFLLFIVAATHGYNGIRVILGDYVRHPLLLSWLKALLFAVWLFLIGAGAYLVFVFATQ